jgi:hypothetical protein
VDPVILPDVRKEFNSAVMRAFILPIAVEGVALLLSFGMERVRIKDEEPTNEDVLGSTERSLV